MRGTLEELSALVGLARDASGGATFHERAGGVAASLQRLVPFTNFVLVPLMTVCTTEGPPDPGDAFVTHGLVEAWAGKPAYFPHYFAADPRRTLFPGGRLGRIAVPSGKGLVLTSAIDGRFGRDAFTGEYMGFSGTRFIVDVFLDRADGRQVTMSLLRERRLGDFEPREVQLLELVGPELVRVSESAMLEAELARGSDQRRVVLLVDGSGEPLQVDPRSTSTALSFEERGAPVRRVIRACLDDLRRRCGRRGDVAEQVVQLPWAFARVRCGLLTEAGPAARAVVTISPLPVGSPEHVHASMGAAGLSRRERQVARLVAQGFSDGEVSRAMGIAVVTVKAHLRTIYRKLHVRGRTGMAAALLGGSTRR